MFTGVFEIGVKMAKIDWEAAVLPLNYARLEAFCSLRHRLGTGYFNPFLPERNTHVHSEVSNVNTVNIFFY